MSLRTGLAAVHGPITGALVTPVEALLHVNATGGELYPLLQEVFLQTTSRPLPLATGIEPNGVACLKKLTVYPLALEPLRFAERAECVRARAKPIPPSNRRAATRRRGCVCR
jgi:hypothetical protein